MFASVVTCLNRGLEGRLVRVQVDVGTGVNGFFLVGLAGTGVREARERVRSALRNSLLPFPRRRLTVNLAPAELRKEGSGFDLPIALGIALAQAGETAPPRSAFIGELALDGTVHHVDGAWHIGGAATLTAVEEALAGSSTFPPTTRVKQLWWRVCGCSECLPWPSSSPTFAAGRRCRRRRPTVQWRRPSQWVGTTWPR